MVSTPTVDRASYVAASSAGLSPVRSSTSRRKARSVGAKAVSLTEPSARTATALSGLAPMTSFTAWSRMSKSFQVSSNSRPSAARTSATLVVPRPPAWAGVAVRDAEATAAMASEVAVAVSLRMMVSPVGW